MPDDGGAAWCLSGTTANCGTNAATLHCAGASDCSSGNVCCGNYDLNALTAQTFCQKPSCPVAQFCETDTECPTGVRCTPQTCGKVMLYMCGLMSKAPYNCVAN